MEKENEIILGDILQEFPREYIYYSPKKNKDLKEIFSKASKKTKDGKGRPDRIIYNEKSLLVFEVKAENLKEAVKDLKIYKDKMLLENFNHLDIYFIAFINHNEYVIFDKLFKKINLFIKPENFHMNKRRENDISIAVELKKINQYIYDNMSIPNDDKAFFIALILIGIKSEVFRKKIKELHTNDKYGILLELRKIIKSYDINISNFDFIKNDLNNEHLYWIISKCIDVYEKCSIKVDLMSRFYNEFIKYNNDSLKSVGCVLTPDHASEIMADLLEIKKEDTILDLCAGTGSLIYQCFLKSPKKIIACENQSKLVDLLNIQKILLDTDIISIEYDDCFKKNYMNISKSIINPPYEKKTT